VIHKGRAISRYLRLFNNVPYRFNLLDCISSFDLLPLHVRTNFACYIPDGYIINVDRSLNLKVDSTDVLDRIDFLFPRKAQVSIDISKLKT
jgi:hypothetical protein